MEVCPWPCHVAKPGPTNDSRTLVDNSAFESFPRNKGSLRRGQSGLFLPWKQSTKQQRREKNGVEIRISSDSKNPFLGRDTDRRPITTCLECRRAAFSNFAQLNARLAASRSFSTIEREPLSIWRKYGDVKNVQPGLSHYQRR